MAIGCLVSNFRHTPAERLTMWRQRRAAPTTTLGASCGLGAGLGLIGAAVALAKVALWVPRSIPRLEDVTFNPTVALFSLALAGVTALLFGLPTALKVSKASLRTGVGTFGDRREGRLRHVLVIAEVAVALVLLVGAGLLLRSFQELSTVATGFDSAGRLSFSLTQPSAWSANQQISFQSSLVERLQTLPGVRRVAVADHLPLRGQRWTATFRPEGHPPEVAPGADIDIVGPDYFAALGMPLLAGRTFQTSDRADTRRVVIADTWVAARYLLAAGESWEAALGQRINIGNSQQPVWREIIGVTEHVRMNTLGEDGRPQLYFSATQLAVQRLEVIIESAMPGLAALTTAVRGEMADLAPELPIDNLVPYATVVRESIARERFQARVLSLFTVVALLLAAIGLYGVLAFSVGQRRREIGLRMALGASVRQVATRVIGEGMVLAALGTAIGSVLAAVLVIALRSMLWGVRASDPITWSVVGATLVGVALLAAALPALRAAGVDPNEALRGEE